MIHVIHQGTNDTVIFLLHGTGGNERDLMSIAHYVDPQATFIGIRGNVEEQGMLRYFARNEDGTFDMRSLAQETYNLKNAIDTIIENNQLNDKNLRVLGYSNGANIMQSMMKEFELPFSAYYLLHPSLTRSDEAFKTQTGKVFISSGDNDPYISSENFNSIVTKLEAASIEVHAYRHQKGHALIQEELDAVKQHYATL